MNTVAVRLSVATSTVDAVAAGAITGSAAAMSGLVSIAGNHSVLCGLGADGRFRSHLGGTGRPRGNGPPLVAVLGAPNDADGVPGRAAMDRCAAAVEMCQRSPGAELVLCGGYGAHFNTTDVPHWRHCETWLAGRPGYRPRIAACVESRHTYEDVLLLREVVRSLEARSVLAVTSAYHAARARFVLDVALPGTTVHAVPDAGLSVAERDRLRRHEEDALARTVAAALIFGVDRLPAGVTRQVEAGRLIVRPKGTPGGASSGPRPAC